VGIDGVFFLLTMSDLIPQIREAIEFQRERERGVINDGKVCRIGVSELRSGWVFNLTEMTLWIEAQKLIASLIETEIHQLPISVGIIGGGKGKLALAIKKEFDELVEVMMTTLVHFVPPDWLKKQDVKVRQMCIELPDDDLNQKFDLIIAQNSIFFWSQFPELAVVNLQRILKSDGVVLATIPMRPIFLRSGEEINWRQYLERGQDLLDFKQLFTTLAWVMAVRLGNVNRL